MLAERIVSLSWRLKWAGPIQNQTIDAMNADNTAGPLVRWNILVPAEGQRPEPALRSSVLKKFT
ncbi:MAG: hypothetical protein KAY65_12340 [Planctomycetes bacterium]|nr:hypothetical protein [Planctomycetota bacterium]